MLPASNRGPGTSLGFPDVCLTPSPAGPVPVPYPNIAMNAQAAPFAASVKVNMMNALNLASQIPLTSGDEAGSAHATVKGPQRYTMGSPNVFVEGMPAVTLASITSHNNMNCPIGAVIVPSAVNVMFSRVPLDEGPGCAVDPRATRTIDAAALVDLADAARGESVVAALVESQGRGRIIFGAFGLAAGTELHHALDRMRARGIERFTIDVRGVRGGTLEGAIAAAGVLLPKGAIVVREVEPDGDVVEHGSDDGSFDDVTLEVWIDGATASAAEVFAGALRDHGRARLVGERTYGKGVAHRVAVGSDRAPVIARRSTLLRPNGEPLDGRGLVPDAAFATSIPAPA